MNAAADQMAQGVARLASISPEGAKSLAAGVEELRAGGEEIQAGKREFIEAMSLAKSGLARTAASLADVRYDQLRFDDARDLAEQVRAELPDADDASTARLLLAHAAGMMGASGPTAEAEAEMEQALQLAEASGDVSLALFARQALTSLRSEQGQDNREAWRAVADTARSLGDWALTVRATISGAMHDLDDHADEVPVALEIARELAAAHGLTDDGGWVDYVECEARFVRGEWDRAVEIGQRVLDLGEANNYLRLTVRTLHVLIPIARVRGDTGLLQRAGSWYGSLEGKFEFPDSPYARIVRAAQDLDLGDYGPTPAYVPDVSSRIASFEDSGNPSWSAALDRVFRSWMENGDIDGAQPALDKLDQALASTRDLTSLASGTQQLLHARIALARGDRGSAAVAGRTALEHFRISHAPWWMAKAIRLLERAEAADTALLDEVAQIEEDLGASGPTA
jgi:tetratricopeptide (TPR) repeat protein